MPVAGRPAGPGAVVGIGDAAGSGSVLLLVAVAHVPVAVPAVADSVVDALQTPHVAKADGHMEEHVCLLGPRIV